MSSLHMLTRAGAPAPVHRKAAWTWQAQCRHHAPSHVYGILLETQISTQPRGGATKGRSPACSRGMTNWKLWGRYLFLVLFSFWRIPRGGLNSSSHQQFGTNSSPKTSLSAPPSPVALQGVDLRRQLGLWQWIPSFQ